MDVKEVQGESSFMLSALSRGDLYRKKGGSMIYMLIEPIEGGEHPFYAIKMNSYDTGRMTYERQDRPVLKLEQTKPLKVRVCRMKGGKKMVPNNSEVLG